MGNGKEEGPFSLFCHCPLSVNGPFNYGLKLY